MAINNVHELISDLGIGWNLGNTFECHVANPDRTDLHKLARNTTTSWGTPTTQTWFFDAIKHAGFKTVRIPITWTNHVDPLTNNIDIEYLDYINEFVSYIVDTLDMYCIINMHHDDRVWFNANTLANDPTLMQKYTYLWSQIANYFKDYGQKLIFAGLNEPLDSQERWDNTDSVALADVNVITENFVNTVRSVAGNENRYLCLNTYAAKVYALKTLVIPDDKCFADVHIYSTNPNDIKSKIDEASSYGKPYIIGEFGIGKDGFNSIETISSQCFMVTYARTKGVSCVLWDDYGNMQFLRRNKITQNNYKDAQHFNGYLIDLPKILVDSEVVKISELQISTRSDSMNTGETANVYPANVHLNKITYNFSSDDVVAKFSEGVSHGTLTANNEGQTTVSVFSPYGHLAQRLISVGGQQDRVLDNHVLSIQNVDNWSVTLSRVINVLPSNPYLIKCPTNYNITLEEMNANDVVIKTTVISENHYFETSIVTKKLKIIIENVSQKDYSALSRDFNSGLIDMAISYSKYQDEIVSEYNEYINNIVPCDSIELSQKSYNLLSSDSTLDLSSYIALIPANTTQDIRFNAVDPSIVHVSLKGTVTPLKEGETDIVIKCGNKSVNFNVLVDYSVSIAKEKLIFILQEQSFVQNMMVAKGITNADKQELDSLINTSETMLSSSDIASLEIYDHIEFVKDKLFLYSHKNSLIYKYLTSKTDSNIADNKLTNLLFDNTKKLEVTFGIVSANKAATFVSGTNFSIRYENKDIRVTYGSQGILRTQKLSPEGIYTLEICKADSNRAVVLNDEVLLAAIGNLSNIPTDNPLSLSLVQKNLQLFNIKVYDYSTHEPIYNLMPFQAEDKLIMIDVINGVQNEIGTISTHELGTIM